METYISVDIEADGPIPGLNSMLSLGAAVFHPDGSLVKTFSVNIEPLTDGEQEPETMKWWATQTKAWAAVQLHRQSPARAMLEFYDWQRQFKDPVFVAWPVSFEAMFIGWYMYQFTGEHPFNFKWLDINTLAMTAMKCDLKDARQSNFPKVWSVDDPHTHVAVEDAEQVWRTVTRHSRTDFDRVCGPWNP